MAFAALFSLQNTLHCLSNFSRLPSSLEAVAFPLEEIDFVEELLRMLDGREGAKALDIQIREALYGLEDVIESVLSDLILTTQSDENLGNWGFSVYVEEIEQGINSFVETVKKMREDYGSELEEEDDDDDDDDDDEEEEEEEEEEEASVIDFGGKKSKIVGFSEEFTKIKDRLIAAYKSYELQIVSFVGEAGTGRSTFALTVFNQSDADSLFKRRAWVSIGPKYEFKEILVRILSQIDDRKLQQLVSEGEIDDEEMVLEQLRTSLKGERYLIVLDDVWETRVWEYLRNLFPDENNGSRVLLTTHLQEVALFAKSSSIYPTRLLNKHECWNLLCMLHFQHQNCPRELEKPGKRIAVNCEGLVVEVIKSAELLSRVDDVPQHWNYVADWISAESVANEAYDEMSEYLKSKRDEDNRFSTTQTTRMIKEVIGLPYTVDDLEIINVFPNELYPHLNVVAVVGMIGIGKTALAREIFEDPSTLRCYDHRVWVTLGSKYQSKRVLKDIVAQLDPNVDKIHVKGNERCAKHITSILSSKRCLIVLDDVCDKNIWLYMEKILPGIKCEVLLTTRLRKLPLDIFGESGRDIIHEIPLLNEEQSWSLLRERVFGEKSWPRELEEAGKLIAEECDGLPLMIVTVADLLLKGDDKADEMSTLEYWNKVSKKKNSVFEHAYDKISKVLYPSYKDLKSELKTCFLYMAAFRVKYRIPISKLFTLCTVEGILPTKSYLTSWSFESRHFDDLVSKSLVVVHDKKYNGVTKTGRLHSVFWHLCVREASNEKFLHVVKYDADGHLSEVITKQRRLCIQNNVLLGIKSVSSSLASASTARSLLCFGPPHKYQVPICFDLKLLKVLDALTIRLYEFPVEILKLVLLRYLALTYDRKLPASISKLWNLEVLIICRHMSIKFPGDLSYVPMEIWDMKELKHLQIMGSNLPDGPDGGAILENLLTLVDVRAESCTKSILERIPLLQKLGVRIELVPDASEPPFSIDNISHLERIESFKCVIVNPELKPAPPLSFSMLPSCLIKLSLSGHGYAWEDMRPIALLPYLQVLKLRCYAFQGPEWVMHEDYFPSLSYLLLEDTDLVHWRTDDYCRLQSLVLLIIAQCYKLKDIPWQCLQRSCKTELVDCNPSASARMPEDYYTRVYTSWEGRKKR